MFLKKEVIYLDMSFEQASKFIVSAGSTDPKINFLFHLLFQLYHEVLINFQTF